VPCSGSRLLIEKDVKLRGGATVAPELQFIAACNLQILPYPFLQIATRGSLAFLVKTNDFATEGLAHWLRNYPDARLYFLGAIKMADVIFIAVTVVFFIISWLYVIACDRL
jgi:hypothetical protein